MAHANAKLGPAGRRELVRLMIDEGFTERQAAACLFGVADDGAPLEAQVADGHR